MSTSGRLSPARQGRAGRGRCRRRSAPGRPRGRPGTAPTAAMVSQNRPRTGRIREPQQGQGAPPDGLAFRSWPGGRCPRWRCRRLRCSSGDLLRVTAVLAAVGQFRVQVPRLGVQAGDHVAVVAVRAPAVRRGCRRRRSGRPRAAPPGRPAPRWRAVGDDQRGGVREDLRAACCSTSSSVLHVQGGERVVEHQHARAGQRWRGPGRCAGAGRRRGSALPRRSVCPPRRAASRRSGPARRPALRPAPRRGASSGVRWPGAPSSTLSRTELENSVVSSKATATMVRSSSTLKSRRSTPSIVIAPAVTSYSRGTSWSSVLLPLPVMPTSAMVSPGADRPG